MNPEYLVESSMFKTTLSRMAEKTPPRNENEPRDRILDTAEQRFRQYGYRKTTVAEIAGDLGMSAANLYRFFENKEDIAAACAQRCMSERDDRLRQVLAEPAVSAGQRLQNFVLASLRYVYDQTHNHPHINELVETVVAHRPDVVRKKIDDYQAMLEQIIDEGRQSGEFAVDGIDKTAATVHYTLLRFTTPIFMKLNSLEEMEQMAQDLVDLLIRGLANR